VLFHLIDVSIRINQLTVSAATWQHELQAHRNIRLGRVSYEKVHLNISIILELIRTNTMFCEIGF